MRLPPNQPPGWLRVLPACPSRSGPAVISTILEKPHPQEIGEEQQRGLWVCGQAGKSRAQEEPPTRTAGGGTIECLALYLGNLETPGSRETTSVSA